MKPAAANSRFNATGFEFFERQFSTGTEIRQPLSEAECGLGFDSRLQTQSLIVLFNLIFCSWQAGGKRACRNLIPNIHSSHDLNRPEAKRFGVKLANVNIPKIDLVEVFTDLLEAENLKSKNLADEYTAFMPAYVATVVHSPEHKSMRINELDRISRQQHRT